MMTGTTANSDAAAAAPRLSLWYEKNDAIAGAIV